MKIAICDDEKIAREAAVTCVEDYSVERRIDIDYEIFDSYVSLADRIDEFDIFIMDYQTPEIDGMTFAKKIREKYNDKKAIIFVTSFREIVYDAFEVKTHRFLVKPLDKTKFFEALDSYIKTDTVTKNIVIKNDGVTNVIDAEKILYISPDMREAQVHTDDETFTCRKTMSAFENELCDFGFYRIHRSYLVNIKKIKNFSRSSVELVNGEQLDMSPRKYQDFCKIYLKTK